MKHHYCAEAFISQTEEEDFTQTAAFVACEFIIFLAL